MNRSQNYTTYITLFLAVLFWGLSFIGTKIALQSFSTFSLIFIRFFSAALFFIFFFWRTGFKPLNKNEIRNVIILALMQPGLYFTFETLGLQFTSATKTSLIIATIPVFVLLFSAVFLKERISFVNISGILLSLLGVALLVFGDSSRIVMGGSLKGDLLILGAVFAASAYMIMTRKLGTTIPSHQITGLQIIIGAVLFLPLFLWDLPHMSWNSISLNSLVAIIGLTLFATIGAFLCYNYALTQISAAKASVCINGIPLVTAFAAWIILGESLTPLQMAGAAVVLFSVFLVNWKVKEEDLHCAQEA